MRDGGLGIDVSMIYPQQKGLTDSYPRFGNSNVLEGESLKNTMAIESKGEEMLRNVKYTDDVFQELISHIEELEGRIKQTEDDIEALRKWKLDKSELDSKVDGQVRKAVSNVSGKVINERVAYELETKFIQIQDKLLIELVRRAVDVPRPKREDKGAFYLDMEED